MSPVLFLSNCTLSPASFYPEKVSFVSITQTPARTSHTSSFLLLAPSNRYSTSISTVTSIARACQFHEITGPMVRAPAYNRCIIRGWQWSVARNRKHRTLTKPAHVRWLIRMKLKERRGLTKACLAWTCKGKPTLSQLWSKKNTSTLNTFWVHWRPFSSVSHYCK
jgi:hypothetical protein